MRMREDEFLAMLGETQEANARNEQALVDLQQDHQEQLRVEKETAEEAETMAEEMIKTIQDQPHAFFYPHALETLSQDFQQAKTLCLNDMFSAGIAIFQTLTTKLSLLSIQIKESYKEWKQAYEDIFVKANALKQRMIDFETTAITTLYHSAVLTSSEREKWSNGCYQRIKTEIVDILGKLPMLEDMEVMRLMNQGKAMTITQMRKMDETLDELQKQLSACIACIYHEVYFFDERKHEAESIKDLFLRNNFWIVEEMEKQNALNVIEINATMNEKDYIVVRLLPVRKNGMAIGNQCHLIADYHLCLDPMIIQSTLKTWSSLVGEVLVEGTVLTFLDMYKGDRAMIDNVSMIDPMAQKKTLI